MFKKQRSKTNTSSFTFYFDYLTKLVNILISLNFKESYSKNCAQASREVFIYCLLNDKKYAQKVWSKDLVYKKPFGYRNLYYNLYEEKPRK